MGYHILESDKHELTMHMKSISQEDGAERWKRFRWFTCNIKINGKSQAFLSLSLSTAECPKIFSRLVGNLLIVGEFPKPIIITNK